MIAGTKRWSEAIDGDNNKKHKFGQVRYTGEGIENARIRKRQTFIIISHQQQSTGLASRFKIVFHFHILHIQHTNKTAIIYFFFIYVRLDEKKSVCFLNQIERGIIISYLFLSVYFFFLRCSSCVRISFICVPESRLCHFAFICLSYFFRMVRYLPVVSLYALHLLLLLPACVRIDCRLHFTDRHVNYLRFFSFLFLDRTVEWRGFCN